MLIAIDFDGVITADERMWMFAAHAIQIHGHKVITVTHRSDTFENAQTIRNSGVNWPIVFANDKPKKLAAIAAGYSEKGADVRAVELLGRRRVQKRLDELFTERASDLIHKYGFVRSDE